MIFLLNPMLVQQQASCSCDAVVNLAAISFLVLLLHLLSKESISKREIATLACLFLLTSISKYIYFFMGYLFLLFVPRLNNRNKEIGVYVGVVFLSLLAAFFIITCYHGSFMPEGFALLRQPSLFVSVLCKSIWKLTPFYVASYAGQQLGQLNILVWEPCLWLYLIIQTASLFYNSDCASGLSFKGVQYFAMFADTFLIYLLALLSMRSWSLNADHNYDFITGVQGRYLIPVAFQSMIPFHVSNRAKGNVYLLIYVMALVAIFIIDFATIVRFF